MASVKVLLRLNKMRTDGSCPIIIQIINNRSLTQKFLGHAVKPEEWDEKSGTVLKSHPNSVRINHLILKKMTEVSAIILDADNNDLQLTKKQIKHKIKHQNKSSFNIVANEHLSDLLKLKKFNQESGERPRVNHFKNFIGNEDISFQNITPPLLKKFMIYLKAEKGLNDRSTMNCLVVIRTIFNKAINEGLVESKHYPFGPGKIQIKFIESKKIGLNEIEVKKLEDIVLVENSAQFHARNIWLTSFYLAGIRISDIIKLKWTDINDGRLTYIMGKNQKVVSLKIPEKANYIIEKNRKHKINSSYVFPYLKDEDGTDEKILNSKTRTANSRINKHLATITKKLKIDKKVTMHISRHTFGQIAGDKIAPQLLQKLYRHSDLKTTIGYQANFIHKDVDGALSNILDF
ncbi:MAG: phage integrase SAM-like domain-containing protein [Bacteroidia bacterium]